MQSDSLLQQGRFLDRTLFLTFCSLLLYWSAIPPLNLFPLILLVPALWSRISRRAEFSRSKYRFAKIYLCSFLFWLANLYWVCLPHPLTSLGWIALSAYLALYLPVLLTISATTIKKTRLPIYLVLPVYATALELFRKHIFGGLSLAELQHAFYQIPELIQLADLGGEYTVSFWIILLGSLLDSIIPLETVPKQATQSPESRFSPLFFNAGLFCLVLLLGLLYGQYRLKEKGPDPNTNLCVALTQGNYPVMLNPPENWWNLTYEQYIDLSQQAILAAREQGKTLDFIIWPETIFPIPLIHFQDGFVPESWRDEELEPDEIARRLRSIQVERDQYPINLSKRLGVPLLLGLSRFYYRLENVNEEDERYNSAVFVDPKTETFGPFYDKIHLVMFGEYVPFANYLPDSFPLKTLCQTAYYGSEFVPMMIPGQEERANYLSVNICFEGLLPHLIRRSVAELRQKGKEPDLLVNLSNVGWFYFTSQIDLQFASQVFRSVENRKPYLSATNGGFSAWIDSNGRIRWKGERRAATYGLANVQFDSRKSPYSLYGDWFPFSCLILSLILFLIGFRRKQPTIQSV
ncbi:MAG: apolipoprotein N-acyltransferase [Thermoguttaceae bacterium]